MRGQWLSGLLLAALLAGCVGTGGPSSVETETETTEQVSEELVCKHGVTSGQVTPGSPISAQTAIDRGPAEARITYEPDPAYGTVDLVLEREGSEVWSESATIMGGSNQYQVFDLDAGNYTLTASTDAGFADAQIELLLQWGDGACE